MTQAYNLVPLICSTLSLLKPLASFRPSLKQWPPLRSPSSRPECWDLPPEVCPRPKRKPPGMRWSMAIDHRPSMLANGEFRGFVYSMNDPWVGGDNRRWNEGMFTMMRWVRWTKTLGLTSGCRVLNVSTICVGVPSIIFGEAQTLCCQKHMQIWDY